MSARTNGAVHRRRGAVSASVVARRTNPVVDSARPAAGPEKGLSGLIRRAGEASGASAVARGIVGTVDAGIERMVQLARDEGIPETQIRRALRAQRALERYQSMVALLLPFIPSPKLMRLLAKK